MLNAQRSFCSIVPRVDTESEHMNSRKSANRKTFNIHRQHPEINIVSLSKMRRLQIPGGTPEMWRTLYGEIPLERVRSWTSGIKLCGVNSPPPPPLPEYQTSIVGGWVNGLPKRTTLFSVDKTYLERNVYALCFVLSRVRLNWLGYDIISIIKRLTFAYNFHV